MKSKNNFWLKAKLSSIKRRLDKICRFQTSQVFVSVKYTIEHKTSKMLELSMTPLHFGLHQLVRN